MSFSRLPAVGKRNELYSSEFSKIQNDQMMKIKYAMKESKKE